MKLYKVFFIFLLSTILANSIIVDGYIFKVFNDGKRSEFINQNICVKGKVNCIESDKNGYFKFKKIDKKAKIGEKIQLEIIDKNWFMLSPFKGVFHVPQKKEKIKILMVHKSSALYQTLFIKEDYFRIQLSSIYDERNAIHMTRNLQKRCFTRSLPKRLKKSCWKQKGKSKRDTYLKQKSCIDRTTQEYCIDNIYYQPFLRNNIPNNGYVYKVFYGRYDRRRSAEDDLKHIKDLRVGWIRTYIKVEEK